MEIPKSPAQKIFDDRSTQDKTSYAKMPRENSIPLTLIHAGEGGAQSSYTIRESRFLRNGTSNEPETSL